MTAGDASPGSATVARHPLVSATVAGPGSATAVRHLTPSRPVVVEVAVRVATRDVSPSRDPVRGVVDADVAVVGVAAREAVRAVTRTSPVIDRGASGVETVPWRRLPTMRRSNSTRTP
jgi:hypothetical protein